jgi:uncharacterized protein YigE (DUF2233 family)
MNYKLLLVFTLLLVQLACKNLDTTTQQSIKKESKKAIKQLVGAAEHFDATQAFIDFETRPTNSVKMFWQNENKQILGSLGNVVNYCQTHGDSLLYACNGGMYMQDQSPLGLFIYKGKTVQKINMKTGTGNFYLNPKGIFFVLKTGKVGLANFTTSNPIAAIINNINYATQSGPMLITNGAINPLFVPNSTNLNIRNGVGILPNGQAVFAMSTTPINFYDFATYFKNKGCKQALYLDGFVSRTYCPNLNYKQLDGGFGVMIGVVDEH